MSDHLASLLKRLAKKNADPVAASDLFPDERLIEDPLTNELVVSLLLWESSLAHASKAFERIRSDLVDLNELRVCTPEELVSILGARMPRASERALRLLSVLNTIYERQNSLSLEGLREMNKREVLAYLTGIDGLPPYAVARVLLLGLGLHAFPLDERLAKKLVGESVLDSGQSLDQQSAQMERLVRASEGVETYTRLERWAQESRASSSTKKTAKKSTRSTKKPRATKGASS